MKITEWLNGLGINCLDMGLTEVKAKAFARPPEDGKMEAIGEVRRIVIHHSATDSGNVELFRALHRGVNLWSDVGYHFVIGNGTCSGDGQVESGRSVKYRGAHAKGANEDSIGICLVGNFNHSTPTPQQYLSLGKLLKKLMAEYCIHSSGITLHRLVKESSTQCPGRRLTMEKVMQLLDG